MTPAPRIYLSWYYHLPHVASALEVHEHVGRSLLPLLDAHHGAHVPVLFTPTGSFLSLIERHMPEVLQQLKSALHSGMVELGGACYYEVDPLRLPLRWLSEHIRRDWQMKVELLGSRPRFFHVPNFRWRAGLEHVLVQEGYRLAVLDSAHFEIATRIQTWQWADDERDRSEFESGLAQLNEFRDVFSVGELDTTAFRVVFRDATAVSKLTFGTTGALHTASNEHDLAAASRGALAGPGEVVVLVDDGDRISPSSIAHYRTLLGLLQGRCGRWAELVERPEVRWLAELPSADPLGLEAVFDQLDPDSYQSLLREVESGLADNQVDRLLPLQDVFYSFWHSVGRRRRYVDEAMTLLRERRE